MLAGVPDATPWTMLSEDGERPLFTSARSTSSSTAPRRQLSRQSRIPARRCCGSRCDRPASSRHTRSRRHRRSLGGRGLDPVERRSRGRGADAERRARSARGFHRRASRRAPVPQAPARSRRSGGAGAARTDAERARMSEPENFVTRWSRRKREAAHGRSDSLGTASETGGRASHRQAREGIGQPCVAPDDAAGCRASFRSGEPAADRTRSRQARTSGPFCTGVPPELTSAALRRAWIADPAIRDFVGLAENPWDFNAPGSIAGFGPLRPTDDVAQLVSQALGKLGHQATTALQADPNPEQSPSRPIESKLPRCQSPGRSRRPEAAASDDPPDLPGDQGFKTLAKREYCSATRSFVEGSRAGANRRVAWRCLSTVIPRRRPQSILADILGT